MSVDNFIQKVADEYDHSRPLGTGFDSLWNTPKHTFLAAPMTEDPCLEYTSMQQERLRRPVILPSNLEHLPHEILLAVFDRLDIASLASVASANSKIRRLVRSMPQIAHILRDLHTTDAVARMIHANTARYFTPEDFMKVFQSPSCGLCRSSENSDADSFASDVCLLRCCRVCRECLAQQHEVYFLPLDTAEKWFVLKIEDHKEMEGLAQARVIEHTDWDGSEEHYSYKSVEVISMEAATRLAVVQHRLSTPDIQPLDALLEIYLSSLPYTVAPADILPHAEGIEARGFKVAVEGAWMEKGLCLDAAKRSMLASLPYLHPNTSPGKVEPGITCGGCARDRLGSLALEYTDELPLCKVYLRKQFIKHLTRCKTAREIVGGVRFSIDEERSLISQLARPARIHWPDDVPLPEDIQALIFMDVGKFDWSARTFMQWHSKSWKYIDERGRVAAERRRRIDEIARDLEGNSERALRLRKIRHLLRAATPEDQPFLTRFLKKQLRAIDADDDDDDDDDGDDDDYGEVQSWQDSSESAVGSGDSEVLEGGSLQWLAMRTAKARRQNATRKRQW
jgi:hypothetical protein